MRIAFFTSAFSELAIILNRLYVIQNKHNYLSKMTKVKNLAFCITIPIIDGFLPFFGLTIYEFPGLKEMYVWGFSEFGKSSFYQAYQIFNFFFETILPVFTLLALNIYTVRKFDEYHIKKTVMTKKKALVEQTNLKFTKMMITLVTLSVIVRAMDMITGILIRLKVVLI